MSRPTLKSVGLTIQALNRFTNSQSSIYYHSPKISRQFSSSSTYSRKQRKPRGRQVIVWLYSLPDDLNVVDIPFGQLGVQLKLFVTQKLPLEASFQLYFMSFRNSKLIPINDIKIEDLEHSIVVCLPMDLTEVNVVLHQKCNFSVKLNVMDFVHRLKSELSVQYGFHVGFADLVCEGKALQDNDLLLDHKINSKSSIRLILQPQPDIQITVQTFWGTAYNITINPISSMVREILPLVIEKVFSSKSSLSFKDLIKGNILESQFSLVKDGNFGAKQLDYNSYSCRYGIRQGTTLRLVSKAVATAKPVKFCLVKENTNITDRSPTDQDYITQTVSISDIWFVVALKLHVELRVPVDHIHMIYGNQRIDISSRVPENYFNGMGNHLVSYYTTKPKVPKCDLILHVVHTDGNNYQVPTMLNNTLKDVKDKLHLQGLRHLQCHKLTNYKHLLPDDKSLIEHNLNPRSKLQITLGTFPININFGTTRLTVTTNRNDLVDHLLSRILRKINSKLEMDVIYSGKSLLNFKDYLVGECGIYINSELFVQTTRKPNVLHLVTDWEIIPMPDHLDLQALHIKQLKELTASPELLLKVISTFRKWRFRIPQKKMTRSYSSNDIERLQRRTQLSHQSIQRPSSIIQRRLAQQGIISN